MGHDHSPRRALSATILLLSLAFPASGLAFGRAAITGVVTQICSIMDPAAALRQPYFGVESFPLPDVPAVAGELALATGVAGTDLVGIRLKIGLPDGYRFESVEVGAADAVFLQRDRSFLGTVGHLLARALRFVLLGQLATAGTNLEIPGAAWSLLLDASPLGSEESVDLHTVRTMRSQRGDDNTTDHGDFVVCRFLMAANPLSELVGIRVEARNPVTDERVRYHLSRLKLPPEDAPAPTLDPTSDARTIRSVQAEPSVCLGCG